MAEAWAFEAPGVHAGVKCVIYGDDIISYGCNEQDSVKQVAKFHQGISWIGLHLRPEKCAPPRKGPLTFLGQDVKGFTGSSTHSSQENHRI